MKNYSGESEGIFLINFCGHPDFAKKNVTYEQLVFFYFFKLTQGTDF